MTSFDTSSSIEGGGACPASGLIFTECYYSVRVGRAVDEESDTGPANAFRVPAAVNSNQPELYLI